jgi:hypothetical protein
MKPKSVRQATTTAELKAAGVQVLTDNLSERGSIPSRLFISTVLRP